MTTIKSLYNSISRGVEARALSWVFMPRGNWGVILGGRRVACVSTYHYQMVFKVNQIDR